jgi:hypothetical protein
MLVWVAAVLFCWASISLAQTQPVPHEPPSAPVDPVAEEITVRAVYDNARYFFVGFRFQG